MSGGGGRQASTTAPAFRQYKCIDVRPLLCDGGAMASRSSQLQIRVTPEQKEALRRLARRAGQDMSAYVLSRALPEARMRFAGLLEALRDGDDQPGFALAELNDLLSGLGRRRAGGAVEHADLAGLTPYLQNYVAAMVELAAHRRDVPPPAWVRDVEPLETPHFATPLAGLRLHLLRASPAPFKRRNLFIDSSLGDRV